MNGTSTAETLSKPQFTAILAIVCVVTIVLVATFNYVVDPFDLYGISVVEPYQFNRYERKLEFFRAFQPPPEALIIGDSRVESFDPDLVEELTGLRCFNWAQPSARLETVLATLKIAVEESNAPIEMIIISTDPMLFHPSDWISPQARMVPACSKYFANDPALLNLKERVVRLITVEQTESSIMALRREFGVGDLPLVRYREDGMAIYPRREDALETGTYDLEAALEARVPVYPYEILGIEKFTSLSETRKELWSEFVEICIERGIKIYAFMPPMHPRLWTFLNELDSAWIYEETAQYIETTVTEAGGVFRNYTDLESIHGDPELFWDEVHMHPENTELLLRNLLASESP